MRGNMSTGLRQILEVYRLVRGFGYDRQDAVRKVAQSHRVTSRTISSAMTRDISLTTSQLDDYMTNGREDVMCKHLVRRFPSHQDDIEDFFSAFRESAESDKKDPGRILRAYFSDEIENALNDLLLDEVRRHLLRWSDRVDIPEDLRSEIQTLRNKVARGEPF